MPDRVSFTTEDGVTIVGDLYRGDPKGPAALLLHMMPATKESWAAFGESLSNVGWTALAIDLRGHGESRVAGDRRLDHKEFTNGEHQAKMKDVDAAARWLEKTHGVKTTRLALVGASIGANLAIAYAASHPDVPAVVALSPGLNYRGVSTPEQVKALGPRQKLLLAASAEDEYSFATIKELQKLKKGALVREFDGIGHGTAMLDHAPPLVAETVAWLTRAVQ